MSRAGCAWSACAFLILLSSLAAHAAAPATLPLKDEWKLQSSCVVHSTGEQISVTSYRATGWIHAVVPGTVLGSQVAAGQFPNPFFGMNLRTIPGTDYPPGKIFGYFPMSPRSPYRCSWWYRTEFAVDSPENLLHWLHFDGINYRANIWLNGNLVANREQVAGAFRAYDFNVSPYIANKKKNVLAVEVFAQTEKDLGLDFLDWNPAPADKNMGLWRGVALLTTGPVTVRNPSVSTHFADDTLNEADLRVVADVANHATNPVTARVVVSLGQIQLTQQVVLGAQESTTVTFDSSDYPPLRIQHPQVWWPYQYGDPHLEELRISAQVDGAESAERSIRFGIREVQAAPTDKGFLQFKINRRNILIRGGGWDPDLFYREPRERLRQELAYVKHMHLNTIRLEGKLGSEDMLDLADEMGILIMPGWQCCDFWQHWDRWTDNDHAIAHESLYSQISRLRRHPSVFVWLNGSDEIPPPEVEKDYLAVLKERDWSNPVMNSAADRTSAVTGPSGVKMSGPYDYVPPEYWYIDTNKYGGAFGFNTETGPGAAVPDAESIHRTLPRTSWWPQDAMWTYHAALGKFAQYKNFNNAMNATYGPATNLKDYVQKAQLMAYDGERAMFEAYTANKYQSTGVIQWMLNNAWPSFLWHLYDYYLIPGGGYFGTRKANEPVHVLYRYDDRKVAVANATLVARSGLAVRARMYDLTGKEVFDQESAADVAADGVVTLFRVPVQAATSFLDLELRDSQDHTVSQNFYWIPAKLAQMDWGKTTYVTTPASHYADMRDLSQLPPASVAWSAHPGSNPGEVIVGLRNNGKTVAFFLHLRAVKAGGDDEVAPVFWSDNFVSLAPQASCVVTVKDLPNGAELKISGWNVEARTITIH